MKYLLPFTAATLVGLAVAVVAGEGGTAPPPGLYNFKQTAPPPAGAVGAGKFSSSGGVDTLRSQANGSTSSENWTKGSDGQYRRVPPDPNDHGSLCVIDVEGEPLTYYWKWENVIMSEGIVEPES